MYTRCGHKKIKNKRNVNYFLDEIFFLGSCTSLSMWQLETHLFASPYIKLAYMFEASYSTLVTSVSKKSSVNQSELKK